MSDRRLPHHAFENETPGGHLDRVLQWLRRATFTKYQRGQAEHGGVLVRKPGCLANLEAEVLDQGVYVKTLREQLEHVLDRLEDGIDQQDMPLVEQARDILAAILEEGE